MSVLLAAEKWGCPPWEIDPDDDNRLRWLMRMAFVEEQRAKMMQKGLESG